MLLLITNRKSYTGYRLTLNSMTLNAKIGDFMDFLTISGCNPHFKSELHQNYCR